MSILTIIYLPVRKVVDSVDLKVAFAFHLLKMRRLIVYLLESSFHRPHKTYARSIPLSAIIVLTCCCFCQLLLLSSLPLLSLS
jgi:hypothetical protein